MLKDREKLYQIYHTILSMFLTCALTLGINQYYVLNVPVIFCIIFSLILIMAVYLYNCIHKITIRYLILLSILVIAALIFLFRKVNPAVWIKELYQWCMTYSGINKTTAATNSYIILFGAAFIGVIIFHQLMKQQITKNILAGFILLLLIAFSVNKVEISKPVIGIGIFYILSVIVELYGILYSRKIGKTDKKSGIIYLIPICLFLAVLSVSLPSKQEPIQWSGVKEVYFDILHRIEIWKTEWEYYFSKNGGDFSLAFTGYSEDNSDLNNSEVVQNDKIALKVSGKSDKKPIYLIGSVSNIYTGDSWEKDESGFTWDEDEYLLDYIELIYALSRQDRLVLEEQQLIKREALTIEFSNIKTKTCFYPLKSSAFTLINERDELSSRKYNIKFTKAKGEGTNYKALYLNMNLEGNAFQDILKNTDAFPYDNNSVYDIETLQWIDNNLLHHDSVLNNVDETAIKDLLKDRADIIQDYYTKLPNNLPDRVKKLAAEITKDYDNKYDKLKAIEEFLQNYTYNQQPGKLPKGEDFVDYFLFSNKKGYCTYFATSMAVLARCIGIPARYVEGFVVTFNEKDKTSMYPVRNNQAHAWMEAYLEGVGWIPFEATPQYYEMRYTTWKENESTQEGVVSGNYPLGEDPFQDIMNRLENEITITEKEGNSKSAGVMIGIVILPLALFVFILLLISYYGILKYRYNKNFNGMDYSRKMYQLFLRILRRLKREGFILDQQETILMMSKRVGNLFCYNGVTFPDVVSIFMRYRYAEEEITKNEYEAVAKFHIGLVNKQKENQNKIQILADEFIFLSNKGYR